MANGPLGASMEYRFVTEEAMHTMLSFGIGVQ